MMKEFPSRRWKRSTLNNLIKRIDETGSADRNRGPGRHRSVRTPDNIAVVDELICSQEGQRGSSKSPREISRETGILRRSVQRIVKHDLQMKAFRRREVHLLSDADKLKRLTASKRSLRRLTKAKLTRTWFSDEKVFSVQTPTNSQNDRVYANAAVKRDVPVARLLKGRKHFSQKIMVHIRRSLELKKNVTGVCSAWSQSGQFLLL